MQAVHSKALTLKGRVIHPSEFIQALQAIWSKWDGPLPRKIGLAVSGGVDSMALASLCLQASRQQSTRMQLTAFVFDHKIRPESTEEALNVKASLQELGLSAEILTDPKGGLSTGKHMEQRARVARYRAMASACKAQGITALMLGHHAADQAETVLGRIYERYYGQGLAGMSPLANAPNTSNLYGALSAQPATTLQTQYIKVGTQSMCIESGPLKVLRPLLDYDKVDLIATCLSNNVPWFEDPTNADLALTTRNTTRHLHETNQLPLALTRKRLCQLALFTRQQVDQHTALARGLLKRCNVTFDLSSGQAFSFVPLAVMASIRNHDLPAKVYASVLAEPLGSLSPAIDKISSHTMSELATTLLKGTNDRTNVAQGAGMIVKETLINGGHQVVMSRANPSSQTAKLQSLRVQDIRRVSTSRGIVWTEKILWDGRYWISLGHRQHLDGFPTNTLVRFRTPADAQQWGRQRGRPYTQYMHALRRHDITHDIEFSMPVISTGEKDNIVALPSFDLASEQWAKMSSAACADPTHLYFYRVSHRFLPSRYTEAVDEDNLAQDEA